jgi:hypothetical protein
MNNIDSLIAYMGLFFIIGLGLTLAFAGNFDAGCHIVGTEINGDNTVEYLMFGKC